MPPNIGQLLLLVQFGGIVFLVMQIRSFDRKRRILDQAMGTIMDVAAKARGELEEREAREQASDAGTVDMIGDPSVDPDDVAVQLEIMGRTAATLLLQVDHVQQLVGASRIGGAEPAGIADEKRAGGGLPMKALIVASHQRRNKLLAEFWPGWRVFVPGDALVGHRFERVVVLGLSQGRPSDHTAAWFAEELPLKLMSGVQIEVLA
ncbi:MAG: hypothetical protein ACRYG8_06630 [Janthinobacterium lividum]